MSSLSRLSTLINRPVSSILDAAGALVDLPRRVVTMVIEVEKTLAAVNAATQRADALIERIDGITTKAEGAVRAASDTVGAAASAIEQASSITATAAPLLASYSEPLRRLEPAVRRLAESTDTQEVDALVKLIEDHRDEVVVIAAGYPDEMATFISSNPGLESRFPKTIHFPDYSNDELVAIFASLCDKNAYTVGPDAEERLAKEESFYRNLHDGYRNQFARLGRPLGTVGVAAPDREAAQRELARYEALDVVVVRGLANASLEAMGALAAATAPA